MEKGIALGPRQSATAKRHRVMHGNLMKAKQRNKYSGGGQYKYKYTGAGEGRGKGAFTKSYWKYRRSEEGLKEFNEKMQGAFKKMLDRKEKEAEERFAKDGLAKAGHCYQKL